MKSKKLGRSELLSWINKTTECEYLKIEDLSDGIGFCQIVEAFFKGVSHELNALKLNAISDADHRKKNLCILNVLLGKAGCLKQIDAGKLSKCAFSINLEFLQYLYDFISKTFGDVTPKTKYKGLKRRLEILKFQNGNKAPKNLAKLLPNHLISNDVLFQMEKNKNYVETNDNDSESDGNNNSDVEEEEENYQQDNNNNNNANTYNNYNNTNPELEDRLDKYNLFFKLLQEDLAHFISSNKKIGNEIIEAEEEKEYYLEKLHTIYEICDNEKKKSKNKNTKKICDDIIDKISSVPEDFK